MTRSIDWLAAECAFTTHLPLCEAPGAQVESGEPNGSEVWPSTVAYIARLVIHR